MQCDRHKCYNCASFLASLLSEINPEIWHNALCVMQTPAQIEPTVKHTTWHKLAKPIKSVHLNKILKYSLLVQLSFPLEPRIQDMISKL